jgi:hypothetical protein
MLSTHLSLGLPSGLFPSGFRTNILYTFIFSLIHAKYHAYLILLYLIILIILGEECKLWSSSLCHFLQPPVTSSLLHTNILVSILFSNTLSLCSSLNFRDHVPRPYRTTDNIILLCNLIYIYLIYLKISLPISLPVSPPVCPFIHPWISAHVYPSIFTTSILSSA